MVLGEYACTFPGYQYQRTAGQPSASGQRISDEVSWRILIQWLWWVEWTCSPPWRHFQTRQLSSDCGSVRSSGMGFRTQRTRPGHDTMHLNWARRTRSSTLGYNEQSEVRLKNGTQPVRLQRQIDPTFLFAQRNRKNAWPQGVPKHYHPLH